MKLVLRSLAKSPGFTLTVVLTLALGIGANTAIFSVVHAVLLSPLPYPDADRIVAVQSRNLSRNLTGQGFSPAGYREFEKQVTSFEAIAASRYNYANLTRVEKPTQLTDSLVTLNFFEVLKGKPLLGRTFLPEDALGGAKPVVVLSHGLWQSHFGGRADIVGDNITLDDKPHTVIGVMPRTFKEPANVASAWRVFPNEGGENLGNTGRWWGVAGRLKPGLTPASVQPELATISARFVQMDAKFNEGWEFVAIPFRDVLIGNYRDGLVLVIGASLLVLLITCANVAGLQLVRASTRQRDIAVRLAIGASRWAIARAQLAESLTLVVIGGIGGVLLGKWGLDLLLGTVSGAWIPRADEIGMNTTVLAVSGAVALVTGLAFGIYPALRATKVDAVDAIRDGSKGSAGPQTTRIRGALVAGQIALTLVLLVCAGLVVKSFATILRVNPGMQIDNVLSLGIFPSAGRYDTPQ
jgi:predicted permease